MIPFEFTKPVHERRSWTDVPSKDLPDNRVIQLHTMLRQFAEDVDYDPEEIQSFLHGKREEKDHLFHALSHQGRRKTGLYRYQGWAFDFRPVFNRYVVVLKHHHPEIWYAPDKMSIHHERYTPEIQEMHEIPNHVRQDYIDHRS